MAGLGLFGSIVGGVIGGLVCCPVGSAAGVAALGGSGAGGSGAGVGVAAGTEQKEREGNKYEEVKTTEFKKGRRTRSVKKTVERIRTAYRTETKYDVKTRTVKKEKVVEYRLPEDHFMDAALAEIVAEVRWTLRA